MLKYSCKRGKSNDGTTVSHSRPLAVTTGSLRHKQGEMTKKGIWLAKSEFFKALAG